RRLRWRLATRMAPRTRHRHRQPHCPARRSEAGWIRRAGFHAAGRVAAVADGLGHLAGAHGTARVRRHGVRTRRTRKVKALRSIILAMLLVASLPVLAQSTADPTGDWRGTLQAGAVQLRLALHLGETSTFDSPD